MPANPNQGWHMKSKATLEKELRELKKIKSQFTSRKSKTFSEAAIVVETLTWVMEGGRGTPPSTLIKSAMVERERPKVVA